MRTITDRSSPHHSLDSNRDQPIFGCMAIQLEQLLAAIRALPEEDQGLLIRALSETSVYEVREAAMAYLNDELEAHSRMKSILVRLPDDLLRQAQAAGLLGEKPLEDLIRRALLEMAGERRGSRGPALPIYQGKSGLAPGIDPSSSRSLLDAADDDT